VMEIKKENCPIPLCEDGFFGICVYDMILVVLILMD
jgi:hypothetical protein